MKNEYEYSAFIGFIADNAVLVYLTRPGRYTYRISSNNSRPSIYRLPRIIAPPPNPSRHLLFPLSFKLKWNLIQQN